LDGPDNGAENVANWFQTNNVFALYHTLVDGDSTVRVVPAGLDGTSPHTAFHAAGYNSYTLGCSMALQAASWPTLPAAYRDRVLDRAAAEVALWCARWSIPVVARTKAEIDGGGTGITGHGILDPGYRSDPGARFPWTDFLARVRAAGTPADQPPLEDEDMLRVCQMNDGQILLVDGITFRVLPPPWETQNATLVELGRAGLIRTGTGGVPVIEKIGDNAVRTLIQVGA
jgi:hypothetical protein